MSRPPSLRRNPIDLDSRSTSVEGNQQHRPGAIPDESGAGQSGPDAHDLRIVALVRALAQVGVARLGAPDPADTGGASTYSVADSNRLRNDIGIQDGIIVVAGEILSGDAVPDHVLMQYLLEVESGLSKSSIDLRVEHHAEEHTRLRLWQSLGQVF